jgi:hypothetical protein
MTRSVPTPPLGQLSQPHEACLFAIPQPQDHFTDDRGLGLGMYLSASLYAPSR